MAVPDVLRVERFKTNTSCASVSRRRNAFDFNLYPPAGVDPARIAVFRLVEGKWADWAGRYVNGYGVAVQDEASGSEVAEDGSEIKWDDRGSVPGGRPNDAFRDAQMRDLGTPT